MTSKCLQPDELFHTCQTVMKISTGTYHLNASMRILGLMPLIIIVRIFYRCPIIQSKRHTSDTSTRNFIVYCLCTISLCERREREVRFEVTLPLVLVYTNNYSEQGFKCRGLCSNFQIEREREGENMERRGVTLCSHKVSQLSGTLVYTRYPIIKLPVYLLLLVPPELMLIFNNAIH